MKEFVSPELTPIEDLVEGVYALSGAEPPMRYNSDWSASAAGISHDSGSHTDFHIILKHNSDYASPAGRQVVTEWVTDFKINSFETDSGSCTYEITNGGYGFKLTTTKGYNNQGESVDLRVRLTGETEYGHTAVGKSSEGTIPESDHHITSGLTLVNWNYLGE